MTGTVLLPLRFPLAGVSLLRPVLAVAVAMPVLGHATWHLYRRVVA